MQTERIMSTAQENDATTNQTPDYLASDGVGGTTVRR